MIRIQIEEVNENYDRINFETFEFEGDFNKTKERIRKIKPKGIAICVVCERKTTDWSGSMKKPVCKLCEGTEMRH